MHIFLKNQCQKVKTSNCRATNLRSVFALVMLNQQTVSCRNLLKHINHVVTQDIRRFFQSTSAKPAVQRPAPNGGIKTEEKKKNPLSSDEEVKKKKKETAKVREASSVLFVVLICLFHHLIHHVLLCFICFRWKTPKWMRNARIVRKNERSMQS